MGRKKLQKKAAVKIPAESKSSDSAKVRSQTDEEGQPDYGGLPNRNLKKNLGCG